MLEYNRQWAAVTGIEQNMVRTPCYTTNEYDRPVGLNENRLTLFNIGVANGERPLLYESDDLKVLN